MEDFLVYFYQNRELIFVIALSIFLGVEVISNVPSVLHTPLMSGANAISGVIIIGGIILLGHTKLDGLSLNLILGIFAVIFGTLNVVGGFVVTDRMLEMFKKKKKK
ncbi:MAG: pyridine nucleotide transhydrogenase [Marinilabiliales bacterium]|nr:MAG: pyridine nucleotide transhydrogenase [Marinilabiliales bacterium]